MSRENERVEKLSNAEREAAREAAREEPATTSEASSEPADREIEAGDSAVVSPGVRPKRSASAKARPATAKAKAKPAPTPGKKDSESPPARASQAPRSRRAPAAKSASMPAARKSVAPRSRRASTRADEASIPPIASDLDEQGKAVATVEATPILPAPLPAATHAHALESDLAPPALAGMVGPRVSPFWKAVVAIAAVACLVFVGRGILHRRAGARTQVASASAPPVVQPLVAEPSPEPASPAAPEETPTSQSAEETKGISLAALKEGKLEEAIAAGERSTSLDPTDADAWLILGASYQNQGNIVAARHCYRECTLHATRGETRECTFLLP